MLIHSLRKTGLSVIKSTRCFSKYTGDLIHSTQNYSAIFMRSSLKTKVYFHELCHSLQENYQVFLIGPGLSPYTGNESKYFIHIEPNKHYFNYIKKLHPKTSLNISYDTLTNNDTFLNSDRKKIAIFPNSFCSVFHDAIMHKKNINFLPFDKLIFINSFSLLQSLSQYYESKFPNKDPRQLFHSDIHSLATKQGFTLTSERTLDTISSSQTLCGKPLSFEKIYSLKDPFNESI